MGAKAGEPLKSTEPEAQGALPADGAGASSMFPLSVFSSVPNAVQMVAQQKAEAADSRQSGWAPLGCRLRRGLGQATGKMERVCGGAGSTGGQTEGTSETPHYQIRG